VESHENRRFWLTLVAVSFTVTFLEGFDFQILAFAGPSIQHELGLNDAQLGSIGSIGILGMVLGGFCFGYLADRIGRRPSLVIVIFGAGISTLAFTLASDYVHLAALRLISGMFLGGTLPLIWTLSTEFAPARRKATTVATTMVGYTLGIAAGGPVCNLLLRDHGWRSIFFVGGLATLIVLIPVVAFLPESVKFLAHRGGRDAQISAILAKVSPGRTLPEGTLFVVEEQSTEGGFTPAKLFRGRLAVITPLLWICYFCSAITVYFLTFWTPTINERMGFSPASAANIAAVAALCGGTAQMVVGRFIDQKGAIAAAWMPLLALPFLLLIGLGSLAPAMYVVALISSKMLLNGGHGGINSMTGIFYPTQIRANGAGWASSVSRLGGMAGPGLAGVLLGLGVDPMHLFASLAVFPAVMIVLLFLLWKAQRSLPPGAEGALSAGRPRSAADGRPVPESRVP